MEQMRVNLSNGDFKTVFPEMIFSNKRLYLTTVFISNISLEIVRVIAGTGGTNNIAVKLLPQRGAVNLQQFYSNMPQ